MPEDEAAVESAIRAQIDRHVFGHGRGPHNIDSLGWLASGLASHEYARVHMRKARRFGSKFELLEFGLSQAPRNGACMEFGVFEGTTINHLAKLLPDRRVFGFDSFKGLPENWTQGTPKGTFALDRRPVVRDNVTLIEGLFDRSLPPFRENFGDGELSLIHIDCDLYSSTQAVFANIGYLVKPGVVIVFDEYFNYPDWQSHEHKAFREFAESKDISYEYIGLVPSGMQVAVKILG